MPVKEVHRFFFMILMVLYLDSVQGVEFENIGAAIAKALGTTKAFKMTVPLNSEPTDVYYSKNEQGKAVKYAVVQKGVYEPNCTHTWVIGVEGEKLRVSRVRVVEMSCPHAFPTNKASFLDQYKGTGPADVKKLAGQIHTVAKATGSSELTTQAVIKAITAAVQVKGNR